MSHDTRLDDTRLDDTPLDTDSVAAAGVTDAAVHRRNMLRVLGGAAAGAAVGSVALARGASADDGDNLVIGQANTSSSPTWLETTAPYDATPAVGAFHVTNDDGVSDAESTSACISAIATGTGGGAQDTAFWGWASAVTARFDGPVPLELADRSGSGAPNGEGAAGQFKVADGDLWFCVSSDTGSGDAQWRRLTGPAAAGGFVPITPVRVYDSRLDMGATPAGPLASGQNRVIPVRDARSITTGAVTSTGVVPAGARAIAFTVTVVDAVNRGFLYVAPSTASEVQASTINWAANVDGAVANSSQVPLGGDREIRVFCGGANASTQFVVDVTGYYA